jgi:hypothetical protein
MHSTHAINYAGLAASTAFGSDCGGTSAISWQPLLVAASLLVVFAPPPLPGHDSHVILHYKHIVEKYLVATVCISLSCAIEQAQLKKAHVTQVAKNVS